ncbi:MAG TPA: mechanosensitive ion channel family protein [Dehalococcoidia bacterium]|jgi:small conductance mechanosensitive channel|nr:mechanosensitive ion channel family protein [Dehalococcoidia bacterium]
MPQFLALGWGDVEDDGPTVVLIIAILIVASAIFRAIFPRVARAAILRGASTPDEEMDKRADTIIHVIQRSAGVGVVLIGAITILREVGVDITAIVTGLGITGLALALGAQTLVRDCINGIFLLAEDQYRTGDVVRIADVTGTVETITLRRTIIRDDDGVVHSVPNGSINVVSNYTRDFATVNVTVQVAYGEDLSRVAGIIEAAGKELAADERFRNLITEAPAPGWVESVGEGGVTITVSARARPSARWDVAAELRRRLAEAFVREGIRVPFASVAAEEPPKQTPDS